MSTYLQPNYFPFLSNGVSYPLFGLDQSGLNNGENKTDLNFNALLALSCPYVDASPIPLDAPSVVPALSAVPPIYLGLSFSEDLPALFEALDTPPLEALDPPGEPQSSYSSPHMEAQFNNNNSTEPEYSSSPTLSALQSTRSSQSANELPSAQVSRQTRKRRGQVLNGNENEAEIKKIAIDKLAIRKEKNRRSAQESRYRKKQQLERLEQEVASLKDNLENIKRREREFEHRESQMKQTVAKLEEKNAILEKENAKLRGLFPSALS